LSFVFERDEKRPEVRKDVAGSIRFYPKLDGTGNVQASVTAGDNTLTVYSNAGAVLAGPTNVSPTNEGTPAISRFDLAIPALASLGESYFAVLTWKQLGQTEERVETIPFDVVLQPWGESFISLNDLLMRVPGIVARLDRQRQRLDSTGTLTAEQLASQYGAQAHDALYKRIAARVAVDRAQSGGVKARPRLIVNRRILQPIEAALALAFLFRADCTQGASFDGRFSEEARVLFDEWSGIADHELAAIGDLEYDRDEDRVVDDELINFGRVIMKRRVQG
jgi:hypothetical protein